MLYSKTLGLAFLLFSALTFQITAQKAHPTAAGFGGECSGTKNTLSADLRSLIRKQRIGLGYEHCLSTNEMCEDSFAFDLNGDGRREYFVRLSCGATGNCAYGIFTDRPAKSLGTFTAWFFWIDQRSSSWRKITTYERVGGDEGYIQSVAFKRGEYRKAVGRRDRFGSTEKSFPEKMGMPDCNDN